MKNSTFSSSFFFCCHPPWSPPPPPASLSSLLFFFPASLQLRRSTSRTSEILQPWVPRCVQPSLWLSHHHRIGTESWGTLRGQPDHQYHHAAIRIVPNICCILHPRGAERSSSTQHTHSSCIHHWCVPLPFGPFCFLSCHAVFVLLALWEYAVRQAELLPQRPLQLYCAFCAPKWPPSATRAHHEHHNHAEDGMLLQQGTYSVQHLARRAYNMYSPGLMSPEKHLGGDHWATPVGTYYQAPELSDRFQPLPVIFVLVISIR